MKELGPFLGWKNQDKDLFWYYLTLGGERDQSLWSIRQAPFDPHAAHLPEKSTFLELPLIPLPALHAFDPPTNHYYSLSVTTERKLIRFRPIDLPVNMKPFIGETYSGQGWPAQQPIVRAPKDIDDHGYPALYRALQETGLAAVANTQYQSSLKVTAWQTQRQTIQVLEELDNKNIYGILNQCGFVLAWYDLKSTAKTPLDYYYALLTVLAEGDTNTRATAKVSQEKATLAAATSLRRYLLDSDLYRSAQQPLDEIWFTTIFELLHAELSEYEKNISQDHILPLISEAQLRFQQTNTSASSIRVTTIHSLEQSIYQLITHPTLKKSLFSYTFEQLREAIYSFQSVMLKETPLFEEVYDLLEERCSIHFSSTYFTTALPRVLNQMHDVYAEKLKEMIAQRLSTHPTEALIATLLSILETTKDVSIALEALKEHPQKQEALIDALHPENEACHILQSAKDFALLCKWLPPNGISHLYQKREPAVWSKLILSVDDWEAFCWQLQIKEKTPLFQKNAEHFAALIQSDSMLKKVLIHLNENHLKLILAHIPELQKRQWIQTPNSFQELFQIKKNYKTQKMIEYILNAIPSPYRITVLLPLSPEEQAKFLKQHSPFWLTSYWRSLSSLEWQQLFPSPITLRNFALQFDKETQIQLLSCIGDDFKDMLYQQLKAQTPTSPLQDPSFANPTTFEGLKEACLYLFPRPFSPTQQFFQPLSPESVMNTLPSIIQEQPDVAHLKRTIVDIFCSHAKITTPLIALEVCTLIEAYELANRLKRKNEEKKAEDTEDTLPRKRYCHR